MLFTCAPALCPRVHSQAVGRIISVITILECCHMYSLDPSAVMDVGRTRDLEMRIPRPTVLCF